MRPAAPRAAAPSVRACLAFPFWLIQLRAVTSSYFARTIDHERRGRDITHAEYKALLGEEYAWVLDGTTNPPLCHRGKIRVPLKPAEFKALAMLIVKRGEELKPMEDLFGGESGSRKSAIKRFEVGREKVEPKPRPRGGGVFRTIGSGEARRFVFEPDADLKYCLIERAPVQVPSATAAPARSRGLPPVDEAVALLHAVRSGAAQAKPSRPAFTLTPIQAPDIEGIRVHVRSFALRGRHVRAIVTVTNRTTEPKVVSYFTLHVGDRSWKAFRHEARLSRRPRLRATALSSHEQLVVSGNRAAMGILLFPRPRVEGDVEAQVRPHVVLQPVVG